MDILKKIIALGVLALAICLLRVEWFDTPERPVTYTESLSYEAVIDKKEVKSKEPSLKEYAQMFIDEHKDETTGLLACSQSILESGWPEDKSWLAKIGNNLGGMMVNSRCNQSEFVDTEKYVLGKIDTIFANGEEHYYVKQLAGKNRCGNYRYCIRSVSKTGKVHWRKWAIYDSVEDFITCHRERMGKRKFKSPDEYVNYMKRTNYFGEDDPVAYRKGIKRIFYGLKRKLRRP